MRQLKIALAFSLIALTVTFSVQNAAAVEISFLSWTWETRRSFIVAGSIAIGVILGWMMGASRR